MGANDLKASLTLNSTQYETALARADAKATAFANKVQGDLSKKIGKLLGAGAVAGFLFKPLNDLREGLFGGGDRAQKIRDEANALKLTGEEYQMASAAAKNHNMTVEEWLTKMRDSKTPLAAVVSEMERFRSEVKFTDEQLRNLTDKSFQNWIESIGNRISKAKSFAIEGLAGTFANIMTWWDDPNKFKDPLGARDRADAALTEDTKQQALNKQADAAAGSAGLVAALTGKTKAVGRTDSVGINELQRIGAASVGSSPVQQSLNTIARNTEKTATGIELLAQRVRKKEPVSVLDIFDAL